MRHFRQRLQLLQIVVHRHRLRVQHDWRSVSDPQLSPRVRPPAICPPIYADGERGLVAHADVENDSTWLDLDRMSAEWHHTCRGPEFTIYGSVLAAVAPPANEARFRIPECASVPQT